MCVRPDSYAQLLIANTCLYPLFFFFFLGDVAFPEYCSPLPFPFCMESTILYAVRLFVRLKNSGFFFPQKMKDTCCDYTRDLGTTGSRSSKLIRLTRLSVLYSLTLPSGRVNPYSISQPDIFHRLIISPSLGSKLLFSVTP